MFMLFNKSRRPRKRWTEAETETLKNAVNKYGKHWSMIQKKFPIFKQNNRTQVDIKDKWRNLTRSNSVDNIPKIMDYGDNSFSKHNKSFISPISSTRKSQIKRFNSPFQSRQKSPITLRRKSPITSRRKSPITLRRKSSIKRFNSPLFSRRKSPQMKRLSPSFSSRKNSPVKNSPVKNSQVKRYNSSPMYRQYSSPQKFKSFDTSKKSIKNIDNSRYIIYSKEGCPYCNNAKKLLNDKNIAFNEIKVTDKNIETIYSQIDKITKNYRYFPIIIKNNKFIGGFAELQKIKLL